MQVSFRIVAPRGSFTRSTLPLQCSIKVSGVITRNDAKFQDVPNFDSGTSV